MASSCELRHVLVTGTSTGIGRATALRLAAEGFHVFATVRRIADGKALTLAAGSGQLDTLTMDVTDRHQIQLAAHSVEQHVGSRGLDALVNNAGVGVFQPIELVDLDIVRQQFDINVVGQLAVSQAFLPLLRTARGRLVMIGSIGDRITVPFAATKRALLSLTEHRPQPTTWSRHLGRRGPRRGQRRGPSNSRGVQVRQVLAVAQTAVLACVSGTAIPVEHAASGGPSPK
jgi:NAD(P)-dependent dehydrogenase (short-subunit alcohol dehydrogenase family)